MADYVGGVLQPDGMRRRVLGPFHLVPFHIHSLIGFYYILISILIFDSSFLPRFRAG
jgi:hypothetical protein